MWYWLGSFTLVIVWALYYFLLSEGVAMVLHSYLISYDEKHKKIGKRWVWAISAALYLSIVYIVVIAGFTAYNYFK